MLLKATIIIQKYHLNFKEYFLLKTIVFPNFNKIPSRYFSLKMLNRLRKITRYPTKLAKARGHIVIEISFLKFKFFTGS